jgi:hypothetical protein
MTLVIIRDTRPTKAHRTPQGTSLATVDELWAAENSGGTAADGDNVPEA